MYFRGEGYHGYSELEERRFPKPWANWFLDRLIGENLELANETLPMGRQYKYKNFLASDIPFGVDLKKYITDFSREKREWVFKMVHIHVWRPGDYFEAHTDNVAGRMFTYVCELQKAHCNTRLLIDNNIVAEGYFQTDIVHQVPTVRNGSRVSLTVFGYDIPRLL